MFFHRKGDSVFARIVIILRDDLKPWQELHAGQAAMNIDHKAVVPSAQHHSHQEQESMIRVLMSTNAKMKRSDILDRSEAYIHIEVAASFACATQYNASYNADVTEKISPLIE